MRVQTRFISYTVLPVIGPVVQSHDSCTETLWPHCRWICFRLLVRSLVGSGVRICIERDLRLKGRGRGVSGVALDRSIHCSDSRPVSPTGNLTDPWVRQCFKSPSCWMCSLFWWLGLARVGTHRVVCPEHLLLADLNLYLTLPTDNIQVVSVVVLFSTSCNL
jgi:hypothetical protein